MTIPRTTEAVGNGMRTFEHAALPELKHFHMMMMSVNGHSMECTLPEVRPLTRRLMQISLPKRNHHLRVKTDNVQKSSEERTIAVRTFNNPCLNLMLMLHSIIIIIPRVSSLRKASTRWHVRPRASRRTTFSASSIPNQS